MTRRLQRSTLFPYTTLFRSDGGFGSLNSQLSTLNLAAYAATSFTIFCAASAIVSPETSLRPDLFSVSLPAATLLPRSEEHTSELQSQSNLVCRLLLEKKNT